MTFGMALLYNWIIGLVLWAPYSIIIEIIRKQKFKRKSEEVMRDIKYDLLLEMDEPKEFLVFVLMTFLWEFILPIAAYTYLKDAPKDK